MATLPNLKYMALRRQPLPLDECQAALSGMPQLVSFEAVGKPPAGGGGWAGGLASLLQQAGMKFGVRPVFTPFTLTRYRGEMLPLAG